MVVNGSGTIGLEMGSVWIRLGSEVIVVEFLNIIRGAGIDVCPLYLSTFLALALDMSQTLRVQFQKSLTKQGLKLKLSTVACHVSHTLSTTSSESTLHVQVPSLQLWVSSRQD